MSHNKPNKQYNYPSDCAGKWQCFTSYLNTYVVHYEMSAFSPILVLFPSPVHDSYLSQEY